ncbi:dipeptidase [Granulicoccus sp. GXG6511]|uniref:dipeptidase n=1 Tax=Granulicoccus sp. GXG6511 TaxID=3381351 RepID=UPI003D7EF8BB
MIPVLDGHNDLPWELRVRFAGDLDTCDPVAGIPELHTDFPRLRAGGVRGQFWSVFVPGVRPPALPTTGSFFGDACQQIDLVHDLIARHPGRLALATDAADAARLIETPHDAESAETPIASLIGAEGGHAIEGSLDKLRELHRRGVRYLTLTHNENNEWADSATDKPLHNGLSDFGREVVAEMNRLGMMVDLSHTSDATMRDALAESTAPVIFSHSSARAITNHPRNVPDDVLAATAAGGGICMVTFVASFVSSAVAEWAEDYALAARAAGLVQWSDPEAAAFDAAYPTPRPDATLEDVVAHIEHVREVAGIDHVGIGGDFDGTTWLPADLQDVASYPRLFAALAERGWSRTELEKLGWRNAVATFARVQECATIGS